MTVARWTLFLGCIDVAVWVAASALVQTNHRVAALLVGYGAASLASVTLLYGLAARGKNPGPWLKGDRAPWLQPLFLPFRVVSWLVAVMARVVRARSPEFSMVVPRLAVGRRMFMPETFKLERAGTFVVVDLAAELPTNPRLLRPPFERLQLPVLDRCAPRHDELLEAVDWVVARHGEGKSVFVHCAFGRGRSAMVTAAVLLRLGVARDAGEAVALVAAARPEIAVRGAQYAALVRYAEALRLRGE